MLEKNPCPCGNSDDFSRCCQPYLESGQLPATAKALMRSRYSAFALGHSSYLLASWHPTTAPRNLNLETSVAWCGLEILASEGGRHHDQEGMVEFKAHYVQQGKAYTLHEVSRFVKEDGRWLYVDGDLKEGAKVGRNEPCPCGSNKKYKKCCAP
ncbi:MAG: hypothetical protein C0613_04050 [Desulfobulbaceae bacterium]|nr:MAG: hypothetical protein C0613_04050 [Desulfobulbaceae bacterium]